MTRSHPGRPLVVLSIAALLVAACGPTQPSTSPSPARTATPAPTTSGPTTAVPSPGASDDLAATYEQVNAQVRAIRGLDERQPVVPRIVSKTELSTVIRGLFDDEYPPDQVALDERLYRGLGLLPPDASLAQVYVDLLESQVAGLYDPISEQLYVLSKEGGVGPVERVFYAHEYDHALQDQAFDLEAVQAGLDGQTDTALARQSLVEGDAYVTMTYWLQQHLTAAEFADVISASSDPEALAALARIPPIVQAQILFAATQGTQWVLGQQLAGGWDAIDQAFGDPPESTEQILHPQKWTSREAPVAVDLPGDLPTRLGAGWTVGLEDTMGEHQIGIWLGTTGAKAAGGWGGDRIALLAGPDDAWAIAWRTVWDTAADAAEFEVAAGAAVKTAGGPGSVLPGAGGKTRWVVIGTDARVLEVVANALGLAG